MKSSWFMRPVHYEFCKKIREATGYGLSPQEGIREFLHMAYLSLSNRCNQLRGRGLDQDKEERYTRAAKKLENPEAMAHALAILLSDFQNHGATDFLGDVHAALGTLSPDAGQFFTPFELCKVMAEITTPDKPKPGERLAFYEPCVGGGAIPIATHTALLERGFAPWEYYFVVGDVDRKCFEMAYVQLTLAGIPAFIEHANALSLEKWDEDITIGLALWPHIPKREPVGTKKKIKVVKKIEGVDARTPRER